MKTAVFTFGRMNPCTIGHEKLVDKIRSVARLEKGEPLVYLSHSQDKKKNPLQYKDKVNFAQKAFGKIVQRSNANTIIKVLQELEKKYDRVVLVVGSDRVEDMRTLIEKYNGKDYTFEDINVVSAGERDPDADDVSGMSASKMRALASEGDLDTFTQGLPVLLQRDAQKVFDLLRKEMGIKEEVELTEAFDKPYPYKLRKFDPLEMEATAKLDDGGTLIISFTGIDWDDFVSWNVSFYRNGNITVTGEGDAMRIFATVLAATKEFLNKVHPEELKFTAAKAKDIDPKTRNSREKLYSRLTKKFAGSMGYDFYELPSSSDTQYVLTKK